MTSIAQIYDNEVIKYLFNLAIGSQNFSGISTGAYGTKVELTNTSLQNTVESVLAAIGTLVISADKTTITADDVDKATLTVNTTDASLDWLLVEDGIIIGSGTENAVSDVVTLEFSIDETGTYTIWLMRRQGTFASGKIIVEAT
jgi:hypothetical protein